jgi:hypothetical protein
LAVSAHYIHIITAMYIYIFIYIYCTEQQWNKKFQCATLMRISPTMFLRQWAKPLLQPGDKQAGGHQQHWCEFPQPCSYDSKLSHYYSRPSTAVSKTSPRALSSATSSRRWWSTASSTTGPSTAACWRGSSFTCSADLTKNLQLKQKTCQ